MITSALLIATEEGNLEGIKELLEATPEYDLNNGNKVSELILLFFLGGGGRDRAGRDRAGHGIYGVTYICRSSVYRAAD